MSDLRERLQTRSGMYEFVGWWRDNLSMEDRARLWRSGREDWHDDLLDEVTDDDELEQLYARFLVENGE